MTKDHKNLLRHTSRPSSETNDLILAWFVFLPLFLQLIETRKKYVKKFMDWRFFGSGFNFVLPYLKPELWAGKFRLKQVFLES